MRKQSTSYVKAISGSLSCFKLEQLTDTVNGAYFTELEMMEVSNLRKHNPTKPTIHSTIGPDSKAMNNHKPNLHNYSLELSGFHQSKLISSPWNAEHGQVV